MVPTSHFICQVSLAQGRLQPRQSGESPDFRQTRHGSANTLPSKAGKLHRSSTSRSENDLKLEADVTPDASGRDSHMLAINSRYPSSPMSQLYTDDSGLSRTKTLDDQAACEQLHVWTAQVLEQLLRSATAAKKTAIKDLEARCQELCELQARYCPDIFPGWSLDSSAFSPSQHLFQVTAYESIN